MDGEERERAALADQIERAKAQEAIRLATEYSSSQTADLQKKEGETIKLSFQPVSVSSAAPPPPTSSETPTASGSGSGSTPISFGSTPIVPNPLKRPASTNVFKSAKATKVAKTEEGDGQEVNAPKKYKSEAERLMKEDQARKASRSGGSGAAGYGGYGPVRTSKPNLGRTY